MIIHVTRMHILPIQNYFNSKLETQKLGHAIK